MDRKKNQNTPAFVEFDAFSFEGSLWGQFKLKTTERKKCSGLMLRTYLLPMAETWRL